MRASSSCRATQPRLLGAADFAAAGLVQRQVEHGLPHGFLRGKSEQELHAYLGGSLGVAYGVFGTPDGHGTAALLSMALLRLPTPAHPMAGECFPHVPPADWPLRAAFLEQAMVLPEARGLGHHQALVRVRIAHARRCKLARWICAGVHLANAGSWRNLMRLGLVIAASRTRGGATTLALLMRLNDVVLHTDPCSQRWVIGHDAEGHASALEAGYFGVRPALADTVIYQRRCAFDQAGGCSHNLRSGGESCLNARVAMYPGGLV